MTLPASPNSISLSQVNTELGRSTTAMIDMNDSAVRSLFGKPGSGTTISMDDGRGKSNGTISLASLTSVYGQNNAATAVAEIQIGSDGSMSTFRSTYGFGSLGNWRSPALSGVGSSYWVRVTETGSLGLTNATGSARGVWHQISTTRYFGVSTSNTGYGSKTYTVQIATDSGGSNIIATKTGIEIAAENIDQNA